MLDEFESLRLQRYSTLDGRGIQVQTGYRNGHRISILEPNQFCPLYLASQDSERSDELDELIAEICENLTLREREIWLTILDTNGSISETADRMGVTRQAILSRVRGCRRTPGMIHKNDYVAIWRSPRSPKLKRTRSASSDGHPKWFISMSFLSLGNTASTF